MKRIEDYNKVLPILELYRCVQSEGSRFGRPTIAVRTTGCTHRCYFGEGGWCDSWYTSIHPEKGTFTFNDIIIPSFLISIFLIIPNDIISLEKPGYLMSFKISIIDCFFII